MWKKSCVALSGSRGSCMMQDKLPQVMSLESALFGAEDDKFKNENKGVSGGVDLCNPRLMMAAQGYIRCSWHNTPASQTPLVDY